MGPEPDPLLKARRLFMKPRDTEDKRCLLYDKRAMLHRRDARPDEDQAYTTPGTLGCLEDYDR